MGVLSLGGQAGGGQDATADAPLRFAFWDVRADIVRDNLREIAGRERLSIAAECISGDYEAIVGTALAAGTGPDVFYAQRAEAALWGADGLILPLGEEHPAIAPLLARMDPRLVEGARDASGRLLGTTYYNGGPFSLFLRPGADAKTSTWEGVLDLCRKARRDGRAEHPFVPRWHRGQTGLVWSLLCHLASEGVTNLADNASGAVLTEVLAVLLALQAEELVPPESLDDAGDAAAVRHWATGRHVMTFTTDYLAADAATMAGRPVSLPAPRLPGRTGTPLMPGHALICVREGLCGERAEAAIRLVAVLGGCGSDGRLTVHRRWLEECLFAVPYPELMGDPAIITDIKRFFPADEAAVSVRRLQAARAAAVVSPVSHRPFMLAWTREADAIVRDDLLWHRRLSPSAASEEILASWERLGAAHRQHPSGRV